MQSELLPRSPSSGFRYFSTRQDADAFVLALNREYPPMPYGTHAVIVERDGRPVEVNYFIGSAD